MLIENLVNLVKDGDKILLISITGIFEEALTRCVEMGKHFTVYLFDIPHAPSIKNIALNF